MAKSQRLTLRHVQSVYRLLGECRDLGADPIAWRIRLQEGASQIIEATAAIATEVEGFFNEPHFRILQVVYTGLDAGSQELHQRYVADEGYSTFDQPLDEFVRVHRELTTRSHEQLIERRQWERSVLFNEFFRSIGIDDRILSGARLPPARQGRPGLYDCTAARSCSPAGFARSPAGPAERNRTDQTSSGPA